MYQNNHTTAEGWLANGTPNGIRTVCERLALQPGSVGHILVSLSIFNFVPVLAAPIPVRRVREVCADMVGGGGDTKIVLGKRAEEGEEKWYGYHGSTRTQASSDSGSTHGGHRQRQTMQVGLIKK
jgi:hypothetical protein